jgi:hypothetical protein
MSGDSSAPIFIAFDEFVDRPFRPTVQEYSSWLHRQSIKSKAAWVSVMKGLGYDINIDPRACFEKYPSTGI